MRSPLKINQYLNLGARSILGARQEIKSSGTNLIVDCPCNKRKRSLSPQKKQVFKKLLGNPILLQDLASQDLCQRSCAAEEFTNKGGITN
jgi:hypothetical protein